MDEVEEGEVIERWGISVRWRGSELFAITFWRQVAVESDKKVPEVHAASTETARKRIGFRGKVVA